MLINTSRGGLIATRDVIAALKSGQLGYLGLDVYEQESDLFFHDLSGDILQVDLISRLISFPNVPVTAHQGGLYPGSNETNLRNYFFKCRRLCLRGRIT